MAFASRPGVNPRPSDALEAALENTTKGGKALFDDISKYSPEHAEMELLAAAKDVWRSMKASGMCDSDPGLCLSLDQVRRMKHPVSSLGFGNFVETQARLRDLQAKAFANAQSVFQNQLDLVARWRRDYPKDPYYARRTAELQAQLDRMAVRFEQLSKDHPQFAELVGQRARQFWRQQMDRSRALGAAHAAAAVNPGLLIVLEAAVFYQCVDEGKDPSTGLVSNTTLTTCFALSAAGHLVGLALERAVPVVLSLPGVGIVATGVVGLAVGGAVVFTAIEAVKTLVEIARYASAWLEVYLNESQLEELQQRNAASFEVRLAAEQKVIADALRPLQTARVAIETQLDAILRDQTQLAQSLRVGWVRLRSLMQQLKQRMVPACDALAGPDPLERYATSAEHDETLVEQHLHAAESGAAACVSPSALGQATAAFTQATATLQRIEASFAAAATLRSSRTTRRTQVQEQLPTLAQARTLWERLVAMLPEAERAREAYAPVPPAVWDLNDRIAVAVHDLNVRHEAFVLAFPPALLEVPANRDRILRMKTDIASVRPIDEERVEALHNASIDVGVTLVNLIRGEAIDIERPLRELGECATRPSDAETMERIDTAKTLAQLAMAKLGAAYRRSAFVCQQRLAGNGTTAVDRGGSSFDPSLRDRATPPSPRDRATDPDGSRSTSADPANAAHRDDAEKDARTRDANRRTRADEIRRLAEQTLNALAQSAAAVTPNPAPTAPPLSPPAPAAPPAVKAQTERAPTPTTTATKIPT